MVAAIRSRIIVGLTFTAAVLVMAMATMQPAGALTANLGNKSPFDGNSQPSQTVDGQSRHHHRLRFTELGEHYTVQLRVYMNNQSSFSGRSVVFNKENNQCFTRMLNDRPADSTQIVIVNVGSVNGVGGTDYPIQARYLCDNPTQGLFGRNFALTNPQHDADIDQWYVEVSVRYNDATITQLIKEIGGPTQRNAIGFSVRVPNAPGAKVAPTGAGGRNYSVLGNMSTGSSTILLPFADKCYTTGGTRTIVIYDADYGNSQFGDTTIEVFRRGTNNKVNLTGVENTAGVNSTTRILTATSGNRSRVSFESEMYKQYVIRISGLHNGNTIDISLPSQMEAIYGTVQCVPPPNCDDPGQPPCPQPEPRTVSIDPVAAVNQSDMEPGESTTATAYASVDGFPSLYAGDWPYNEDAVRNAVNLVSDGIAAARPQAENYRPADGRRLNSASTGNLQAACARMGADGTLSDRDYRQNCSTSYTHYVCANGSTRTIANGCGAGVGGYRWRCAINGDYWAYNTGATSSSGCGAVYDWRCWGNDAVVATQHNQPGQICTRWYCNLPSNNTWNDMSNPPNDFACKIFRCAAVNPAGITLPRFGGNGVFSNNQLELSSANSSDPNYVKNSGGQQIIANGGCGYRCTGTNGVTGAGIEGGGAQAPLDTAEYGNDKHCYYQPTFHIQCNINGMVFPAVLQPVQFDGNYCINHPVLNAGASAAIGSDVCMTVSVVTPANGQAWADIGKGNGTTWSFSVSGPATSCAKVIARPIVHFHGGDVSVGSPFTSSICATNPTNSSIVTWPGVSHGGSSVDWAAYASGNITNFATAKKQNVNVPRGLAFANTVGSGNVYGGSYGPMPCIANHAGMKTAGISSIGSLNASLASGSYDYSGPNINNSPTIPKGRQLVIYVDHDLRIGSNISYDRTTGGGWASVDDIPGLKVVVTGNISIAPGVSQLDGIYVAQPDSGGNGGNIYTCADVVSGNPISNHDTCKQTVLTVNGSFIAKRVVLGRTAGTAIQGQPAEVFNYLPEIWFTDWPDSDAQKGYRYDSVSNLPPIL